jgi:hypothetical protein
MTGWLMVAAAVVVALGLAAWRQRQLSRGGLATTLGRLVLFRRSAGSAALADAPSLTRVARVDETSSSRHGATDRWRQR